MDAETGVRLVGAPPRLAYDDRRSASHRSPNVGLLPVSKPDDLGSFLSSRIAEH